MNLCKNTDKVFTELYSKKKTADKHWERIFQEACNGKIDQEALVRAMDQCNVSDQNLIEFDRINRKIKAGVKGYSDEEYRKKYIDPYSQSKAP